MKLHAIVVRRPGCLPLPLSLMASGAAQHDLPAAKQILEDHIVLKLGSLYADKAYIDAAWEAALKNDHAVELITPRKNAKRILWFPAIPSLPLLVLFVSPLSAFSTGSIV